MECSFQTFICRKRVQSFFSLHDFKCFSGIKLRIRTITRLGLDFWRPLVVKNLKYRQLAVFALLLLLFCVQQDTFIRAQSV